MGIAVDQSNVFFNISQEFSLLTTATDALVMITRYLRIDPSLKIKQEKQS